MAAGVLLLVSLIVTGCSSGPRVVAVSGVATHKGKPVPNLLLTFQPAGGRPSWGITDAQGRFTLEYDANTKGAMVGSHTVSAIYRAATPDDEMSGKGNTAEVRAVQAKYSDSIKSPMKIEITKAEENLELKFD
jgi:hypothetical protein